MAHCQFSETPDMAQSLKPGKRLLNHMVVDLARLNPPAVWVEIPISTTSYEHGFRNTTYRMLYSLQLKP